MIINRQDDNYFLIEGDTDFSISFNVPGHIILLSDELQQIFKNPRNASYRGLKHVFPTFEKIIECAECYNQGVTNKDKFVKTVTNPAFMAAHSLKEIDVKKLVEFIKSTSYTPPTVVQQLYMRGYGGIAELIEFSDPRPELLASCRLFEEFIREVSLMKFEQQENTLQWEGEDV